MSLLSQRRLRPLALAAPMAALLLAGAAAPAAAQTSDPAPRAAAPAGAAPAPAEADAGAAPAPDAEAAPAPDAGAAPPPTTLEVTRTDGDWTTACTVGEPRQCVMRQVGSLPSGEEIMEMSIRRIEPQQTQQGTVEALINVRTPLGVLLREGVTIQIDAAQPQRGQFVLCAADGCLLREPLPNSLVEGMKKGAVAKVGFVVPQGSQATRLEADISLSGFTAAFNALAP